MSKDLTSASLELNPNDADVLIRFVGKLNENLKIVEKTFKVKIFQNGNKISISGDEENTKKLLMQSKIYMHQHQMEENSQRNKYRW